MSLLLVLLLELVLICPILGANTNTKETGHVVLITSPFFGHIIPLLDLAKRLSIHHHISYVVSASKLHALKQRGLLDENITSSQSRLEIVGLFDNNDEDIEVTNVGTSGEIQSILNRMNEPLQKLLFAVSTTSLSSISPATRLINRPIDLIISDLFVLPPIWKAHEENIPAYLFMPNSLMTFTRYINKSREKVENGGLGLNFDRQLHSTIPLANGIICNSFLELDEPVLNELRQQTTPGANVSILFVAPLISENLGQKQHNFFSTYLKQWLDKQWEKSNRSSSVIYIAFGSWARLQLKQLLHIARALIPYPFIWSLKTKWQQFVLSSGLDNQRHLLLDWSPQRSILSHPAIRLFISHGGWNSVIESMLAAKPSLVWPLFGDQLNNGYRLEHEFGMGRCIRNTDLSNSERIVSSDELTQYLMETFQQERKYARRAREIQQMIFRARTNSSRLYFEELIKVVNNQKMAHMSKREEL